MFATYIIKIKRILEFALNLRDKNLMKKSEKKRYRDITNKLSNGLSAASIFNHRKRIKKL